MLPVTQHRFIEPLDVLYLRGNQLFGFAGSYGQAQLPPWPSVVAGALRSSILSHDGSDIRAFARGQLEHAFLGLPHAPGPFVVSAFHLARRMPMPDGCRIETLHPLPLDLAVMTDEQGHRSVTRMQALYLRQELPGGILGWGSSNPLPATPVLAYGAARSKAEAGWWLTQSGWQTYLNGDTPLPSELVSSADLWRSEERMGRGLDPQSRATADQKLFTNTAIHLHAGVGFLVSHTACELPSPTLLRLGGDGRGASCRLLAPADYEAAQADPARLLQARRWRMVLTAPAIFTQGWLPNGCTVPGDRLPSQSVTFALHGLQAQLIAAALSPAETVSGFDIALGQPKTALRAVPAGSVYWLERDAGQELQTDQLKLWPTHGLWSDPCEAPARRAAGFNRAVLLPDLPDAD